ncbi:MAG: pilus assembly protein TadG-related protein [Carboxydocellales bacterium]
MIKLKWFGDQRGFITIITLLIIPIFLLVSILVIDTGYLMAQKAELQGIADAMALACSSGVYQKEVSSSKLVPIKKAVSWELCISPKLAKLEGYRYINKIMASKGNGKVYPRRRVILVEKISLDPTEKKVTVTIKTHTRPGLLQLIGERKIYATATSRLNPGGESKLIPSKI